MRMGGKEVPNYSPPQEWQYIVDYFWRLKQFCKEIDNPITPSLLRSWCDCQGVFVTATDRSLIYSLDHAVRSSLAKQRAENDRYFANKQPKR